MTNLRAPEVHSAGARPVLRTFRHVVLASAFLTASAYSQNHVELPGPSSRRTPIAISEIMYKPATRGDGRNTEFIELYNSNPWPEDISGFRFAGEVKYVFPPSTSIPAQGYLVVAAVPADMQAVHGLTNVVGPYTNSFGTSGTVKLYDEQDALLLQVEYDRSAPWPMGADGTGHSIVLVRASYGEGDPRAWGRSFLAGGSPGVVEPSYPMFNVVLNEVLAHTDLPQLDAIELYNHGNVAMNLSGCILSDDPEENKFAIPTNTVIAPRGYLYFTEAELGFSLDASGETVYFKAPNGGRVLDALRFGAQENGVAYGRSPDGGEWSRLSSITLGTSNAAALVSLVGFNEIMYHPITGEDDDQFIEIYNHGTSAVSVGGWKIEEGVNFTFPPNQVLGANSYLVIARNAARLMTNYPQLTPANTLGNFSGRLSYSGERITLTKPDTIIGTNDLGLVVTNDVDIVVNEVTYETGGRWGRWSDGGGSSLELVDARADKRLAANWTDSDESAKAPWTNIEATGVLDNGYNNFSPLQLGLLDVGECLVDNVEARPGTNGANYAGNTGFESGTSYLSFQGNHTRSSLEYNAGYPASGTALHLRTGDGLQTSPNGVQISLTSSTAFASGQTATLRFKARWLRGCPEPLLRFWGCYLEATGRLAVPANLGSPGLANSKATGNAGPAIYNVRHDPAVPAAGQAVYVTARISDPDGVASVTLEYRVDPSTTTTNVAMNDAGGSGDAVAGDGIYSAVLPGRSSGAVAFVVRATDDAAVGSRFPELVQDNAPIRECVVFWGEPTPANYFGTYHHWMTQANVDRWKSLPIMSNEDIDGTFVYNNRIIYNMGGRYSGSPWHQNYDGPAGNRACHYVWSMPKDDLLLGTVAFNKIHWPGNDIQNDTISANINDSTLQREQAAHLLMRRLGLPWSNRRLVAVYVNGTRRGMLMEDGVRPTGSLVKGQYLPEDSGVQLYKMQRWYEGTSTSLLSESLLQQYTTTGGAYKAARYRPVWSLKESSSSLSDFTNLYTLITAANAYNHPDYTELLENVVDMENWMRMSAANHAVGNWDAVGSTETGQNVDGWVSDQTRWTLFTIDLGICFDNNIVHGLSLWSMKDPVWAQMLAKPKFRRMYCRALNEMVNGPMRAEVINPVMDAKYAAFQAAGLAATAPTSTKDSIAAFRSGIISQLSSINTATFAVTGTTFVASTNSVTLTGTAPVEVVALTLNGVSYTPVWTAITSWSLTLPAAAGTNACSIEARDRYGNPVGGTFNVSFQNPSVPDSPVGNVVFNEIMFNAPVPEAEYVELFNRSTNTPFDLSGWVVNGLDYTFPPGSTLMPQKYLVLAKSSVVFAATYGALIRVSGVFSGNLQSDGETLSLIKPGVTPEQDLVVDRVRYDTAAPWPGGAIPQPGKSLQLADANQDNSRVANWTMAGVTPPSLLLLNYSNTWQFMQVSNLDGVAWPATNFNATAWPLGSGLLAYENNSLINPLITTTLNDPRVATNGMSSGHAYYFRTILSDTANLTGYQVNAAAYIDDGAVFYVNGAEVPTRIRMNSGAITNATLASGTPPNNSDATVPDTFTIPAAMFMTGTNVVAAEVHQRTTDSSDIVFGLRLDAVYTNTAALAAFAVSTPGTANSVTSTLPAFPDLWLNEVQAENVTGLADNFGQRDPWVELYNPGTSSISLDGFSLGTNYTNPVQWNFPSNASIGPGQFLLVWLDGQPEQTSGGILHANFRLNPGTGSLALSRNVAGVPQIVDYLNFDLLTANHSYGDIPDGQPFYREAMFFATPAGTNIAALPPVTVSINEWMAENTGWLLNPSTGNYDDWFELHNPSATTADLSGYYLSDSLANPLQYAIPPGFLVPPNGFLLVWADDKTSANTNATQLHVPFKLSKGGEAIGLFSPQGAAIDAVVFGTQSSNISEGRYPDSGALRLFMSEPSPGNPNILPPPSGPPTVSAIAIQPDGSCLITFEASPGHTYRIEYKNDLDETYWQQLGTDHFATGTLQFISDVSNAPHRFYRLSLVQ